MNNNNETLKQLEEFSKIQTEAVIKFLDEQLALKVKSEMLFYKTHVGKPLQVLLEDNNLTQEEDDNSSQEEDNNLTEDEVRLTINQVISVKLNDDLTFRNNNEGIYDTLLQYYADNDDILNFKNQYECKLRTDPANTKILLFPLAEMVIEEFKNKDQTGNTTEFIKAKNILPQMVDAKFTLNQIYKQQNQKSDLAQQLGALEEKVEKAIELLKDNKPDLPKVKLNDKEVNDILSKLTSDVAGQPGTSKLLGKVSPNVNNKTSGDNNSVPNKENLIQGPKYLAIEPIDSNFQSIFKPEDINSANQNSMELFKINMKELAKEFRQYMDDYNFAKFFVDGKIDGDLNEIGQQQMKEVRKIIIKDPSDFLPKLSKDEELEFLTWLKNSQTFSSSNAEESTKKQKFYLLLHSEIVGHNIKLPENTQFSSSTSTTKNGDPQSRNNISESKSSSHSYIPKGEKYVLDNLKEPLKKLYEKRAQIAFGNNLYLETYKALLIDRWKEKLPPETVRHGVVKIIEQLENKLTNEKGKSLTDSMKVDFKKMDLETKELFFKVNKIAETLNKSHIFLAVLNNFNIISDPNRIKNVDKFDINTRFLKDKICIEAIINYSCSTIKDFKKSYKKDFAAIVNNYVSNKENHLDKKQAGKVQEQAQKYFNSLVGALKNKCNIEKIKDKFLMPEWQNKDIRNMFFEITDEDKKIDEYFENQIKNNERHKLEQNYNNSSGGKKPTSVIINDNNDIQKNESQRSLEKEPYKEPSNREKLEAQRLQNTLKEAEIEERLLKLKQSSTKEMKHNEDESLASTC